MAECHLNGRLSVEKMLAVQTPGKEAFGQRFRGGSKPGEGERQVAGVWMVPRRGTSHGGTVS